MRLDGNRVYMDPETCLRSHKIGYSDRPKLFIVKMDLPNDLIMDFTACETFARTRVLDEFVTYLNTEYGIINNSYIGDYFPDFPTNNVEEWALDFNNDFVLIFDGLYESITMQPILGLTVYGNYSSISSAEYVDAYKQAVILDKLAKGTE